MTNIGIKTEGSSIQNASLNRSSNTVDIHLTI